MVESHDDCPRRIADIPEDQLAVIVERSSREETWHIRPNHLEAVPPTADLFGIVADVDDVGEGNLQTAAKSPHPVEPFDLKDSSIAFNRHIDHVDIICSQLRVSLLRSCP